MTPAERGERQPGTPWGQALIVALLLLWSVAALQPDIPRGREAWFVVQDEKNLLEHYKWLQLGFERSGQWPSGGGHELLLDPWMRGLIEPTVENFDRFFTPGPERGEDAHYLYLRAQVQRGETIWPDLASVGPDDTHYAARATAHLSTMQRPDEAIAANDNEPTWDHDWTRRPGWAFRGGTVNILWGDGRVRPLTLQRMMDDFEWPGLEEPFPTFGLDSPHPALQKLDH